MNLILLTCGGLGFEALKEIPVSDVRAVFTDKHSTDIHNYTVLHGIPLHIGNPRNIQDWSFIREFTNAWILSVNYLYIINEDMLQAVENRALNIHGSLLPLYRGRTPHVWAIINGETETGITVHRMSQAVDEGDILIQHKVSIAPDDTGGTLLRKYSTLYPVLIRQALAEIKSGNPTFIRQDNEKATYFPKRSESDGKINWAWHRNRIINWVRAQTSPYPGAFSINPLTGEKIRILDCHAVDLGFHSETLDGTVLSIENDAFSVKCPNGVVCISSFKGEVMPGIQLV